MDECSHDDGGVDGDDVGTIDADGCVMSDTDDCDDGKW